MATQFLSKIHPYSWEEVYKAAVLEPDNALLEQRIRIAENLPGRHQRNLQENAEKEHSPHPHRECG